MNLSNNNRRILAVAFLCLTAACATTPKTNPQVEAARQAYTTARANASAQTYAREELSQAEQMLGAADAALAKGQKQADVDHLAYMSTQLSRTAVALGDARANEERVQQASAERDRIRLQARTQEAELAKSAARQATAQAQASQEDLQAAQQRAEQLAQENQALQSLNAKQSSRGLTVSLGNDVLFDTGKSDLKSGSARDLDTIAQFLKDNPNRQVLVEGFTDSVGSDEFNLGLSQRRADAVRSALISRGVDASRVTTHGYGEAFPIGSNDDAGGRQLNRRVEIVVSNDGNPIPPRA